MSFKRKIKRNKDKRIIAAFKAKEKARRKQEKKDHEAQALLAWLKGEDGGEVPDAQTGT